MKITKYQHACVVLEEEGQRLLVDPGIYTPEFGGLDNIVAVVITHRHADHFYPENIQKIIDHNPNVRVFTTEQVSQSLSSPNAVVVQEGDRQEAGLFSLAFTGNMHAGVHPDWPTSVQNIGVYANEAFYYAGDVLTPPPGPVTVLAVPVSYAWLKMGEAMDYVASVRPKACFLTHNNPLSEAGTKTAAGWIGKVSDKYGVEFTYLKPGESLNL